MRLKDIVAISKARYDLMINAPEGIDDNKPAHCYVKQSGVTPLLSGCGAGRNSIALSPTGDVFPCILNRRSVGNIMDYTHFSDFLQSEALLELRNKRAACSECKYENCCAGLCRLMGERDSLDCKVINK